MKTATGRLASAILGVAAISVVNAGCDNNHLLGAVDGGGGADTQAPSMDAASAPDVPGVQDAGVSTFTESWTGYIENYMFSSGSDAVRIAFTADSTGQISGVVKLGDGTPPPPATDSNVGYPPDLLSTAFDINYAAVLYLAEGYAYSMRAATIVGARLRFTIETWELWHDWCALQTPAGTSGTCLPNTSTMISGDGMHCGLYDPATSQYVPVDCGKLALCGGFGRVCRCDTQACTVNPEGTRLTFDITIDDLRASGSTTIGGMKNVHFTKDP